MIEANFLVAYSSLVLSRAFYLVSRLIKHRTDYNHLESKNLIDVQRSKALKINIEDLNDGKDKEVLRVIEEIVKNIEIETKQKIEELDEVHASEVIIKLEDVLQNIYKENSTVDKEHTANILKNLRDHSAL